MVLDEVYLKPAYFDVHIHLIMVLIGEIILAAPWLIFITADDII